MYSHRELNRNGLIIKISEARSDELHDVKFSVMADRYDSPTVLKYLPEFKDTELEAQCYRQIASANAGLFFPQGDVVFTVGIEKAFGILNEFDDASKDKVMTLYHDDNMLYVAPQSWVKANAPKYRGFVTAVFGLLNNGVVNVAGSIENSSQYQTRSGRTIVGKKADGTMLIASFKGVTGVSGLTGPETVKLAQELGLTNAVCMDGGGSVAKRSNGVDDIPSTRKIKSAIALYVKDKPPVYKAGDKVQIVGSFTIGNIVGSKAYITELGISIDTKYIKKI